MGGLAAGQGCLIGQTGVRIARESGSSYLSGLMGSGVRTMTYAPFKRVSTLLVSASRAKLMPMIARPEDFVSYC